MNIHRQQLLERFLRYVAIDTQANPDGSDYPSSAGQLVLGRLLVDELRSMGIQDARQNEHGLVLATLPGRGKAKVPRIALNAHLDTSPEASGKDVRPQVIESYQGGDIRLPRGDSLAIRLADSPELGPLKGSTIVTTDGSTLLGGDDKAGVAVIMQAVQTMLDQPQPQQCELCILFTCDEEIGRGVQHVDLNEVNAQACYTLDGSGADAIDVETFSADLATIVFRGRNIHPSIAKGKMVNALKALGTFLVELPPEMAPETTDGRFGFLHPYWLEGQVDQALLKVLLRDFDTARLEPQAMLLRELARRTERKIPGANVEVQVATQYRNLGDGLRKQPHVVELAELAHRNLGRVPRREIVRGGTDGSRLTELGLPTPNLSSGQHNLHSPLEWVCLDQMVQATEIVIELARVWAAADLAAV